MNTIDLTGVSAESWGEAAREALREASRTIRRITKLDVISSSALVEDGVIVEYHTEIRIFFEIEG
ncbi:MAG: dodecin family protein [Actinomycetota bacterium]|nr:dodecin family protein [Actinomycetota bacterium]